MNRFSNFLRSYSPHGRHAMLIALGDLFLSSLVLSNALPKLFDKNNIDLTYDTRRDLKMSDADRRAEIQIYYIILAVLALGGTILASILGVGIIKRSPVWMNVWLLANYIFIVVAFLLSIAVACSVSFLFFGELAMPMASAVIYRSLQCWSVKEVHWELKSTRTLLKESKDAICVTCENNVATV